MSAHLRAIVVTCNYHGCKARATVALHNTYNTHLADYCSLHGQKELELQLRHEREELARFGAVNRPEGTTL